MWKLLRVLPALVCALALATPSTAQPPGGQPPPDDTRKDKPKDYSNSPIVVQMMAFDKKKTGKLTKEDVTDERLHRLFDQADTNKDGIVTKEELMALAAKLEAEIGEGGGRGGRGGPGGPGGRGPGGRGGPGGPGGFGGPDGQGPGGRGGFGGPSHIVLILPPFMMAQLNLTADQKKQLDELQKDVEGKVAKILTDDQKKQLKEMQDMGFGGRGGRGGRGGPGGPSGGGPGGPGGPGGGGPGGPPGGGPGGPGGGPPPE